MGFSTNQLFFAFILAAFSFNLGNALNCLKGHSTVDKSGGTTKHWGTETCSSSAAAQCLKMECENDLGKTVQVLCGVGFEEDCTEVAKATQGQFGGNCPVPVGKVPAPVTKCTSCNSDNCWGTSALPAPEYPMPSAPPAPKSNEGEEQPAPKSNDGGEQPAAPKPDEGGEMSAPKPNEKETPAPKPTEAAASHVPIIGAIGLVAIGVAVIRLGGIQ